MKKAVVVLVVLTLLSIGVVAFAHGPGWGRGHMMGYGMGQGYSACGGPGACYSGGSDQKFLDETAGLRKELHDKKFAYFEAVRKPEADEKTVTKLEKEISELQEKIHEKAPRGAYGRSRGGYGCRW